LSADSRACRTSTVVVVCGVLVVAAVNAFWGLTERSMGSHECFVSVTAREMLESGDWLWPTCNGQTRLQKTPLPYWLVAIAAGITGQVDDFTARLPSALLAVLSAAAILYFVSLWASFRTAALSACVWASSLGYFRNSHNARPDMGLTFFVVVCFLSFYSALVEKERRRQVLFMVTFWVSLGLGMLAKGPAPLAYVFVPLFVWLTVERKWKLLPRFLPVIGPAIFLAITLPWPLFIAQKVHWDLVLWKHEFFDRLFGTYRPGDYPQYYYFLIMFKHIAPWVAFLPVALCAPFFRIWGERREAMKFLWIWFVAGIIFLTIDQGKRQQYILPIMPAMCILIGFVLEDMLFIRKARYDLCCRGQARTARACRGACRADSSNCGCDRLICLESRGDLVFHSALCINSRLGDCGQGLLRPFLRFQQAIDVFCKTCNRDCTTPSGACSLQGHHFQVRTLLGQEGAGD